MRLITGTAFRCVLAFTAFAWTLVGSAAAQGVRVVPRNQLPPSVAGAISRSTARMVTTHVEPPPGHADTAVVEPPPPGHAGSAQSHHPPAMSSPP
jgi:hypothetical protein